VAKNLSLGPPSLLAGKGKPSSGWVKITEFKIKISGMYLFWTTVTVPFYFPLNRKGGREFQISKFEFRIFNRSSSTYKKAHLPKTDGHGHVS